LQRLAGNTVVAVAADAVVAEQHSVAVAVEGRRSVVSLLGAVGAVKCMTDDRKSVGNSLQGRRRLGYDMRKEGTAAAGGRSCKGVREDVHRVGGSSARCVVAHVQAVVVVTLQGKRMVMGCEGGVWVLRRVSECGWPLRQGLVHKAGVGSALQGLVVDWDLSHMRAAWEPQKQTGMVANLLCSSVDASGVVLWVGPAAEA